MTHGVGRIVVGGRDCGAGMALGPRVVLTAQHVIRNRADQSLQFVPYDQEAINVERIDEAAELDAAALYLDTEVTDWLSPAMAVRGAGWRVESARPGTNDPQLTGTVSASRASISDASGRDISALQLQVDQELGNYAGYSGSGVLDSMALAVLGLLVEQKPLRLPGQLGQAQQASNVLYAIPIEDALDALNLDVQTSRPLRFHVGLTSGTLITRTNLLDQTVQRIVEIQSPGDHAAVVLLHGPGGIGKSVLARQLAHDVRVWRAFPGGIIMVTAGQEAAADTVAEELRTILGIPRDRTLEDALAKQRLLFIVDDAWSGNLLSTLCSNLPPSVTVLATTRGVSLAEASEIQVKAVLPQEAIQILARDAATTAEVESALEALGETLFRWPLLLNLAASELHDDEGLDWGFEASPKAAKDQIDPTTLIKRANGIRVAFPDDPTMLDDLEQLGTNEPPRSVDVLVRRSLDRLDPRDRERFFLLSIYPDAVSITQTMLEDLWETDSRSAVRRMRLFLRVGLVEAVSSRPPTLRLHDLVSAWLHHEKGTPESLDHQPIHQRLVGLSVDADGHPVELNPSRAEWLVYHLGYTGNPVVPSNLLRSPWRNAYRNATGTDAAYLHALREVFRHFDRLGHTENLLAEGYAQDRGRAAVTALLHAYTAQAAANISVDALCAQALLGQPEPAFRQAAVRPDSSDGSETLVTVITTLTDLGQFTSDAIDVVARVIDELRDRTAQVFALTSLVSAAFSVDPERGNQIAQRLISILPELPPRDDVCEWIAASATKIRVAPEVSHRLLDGAAGLARKIRDEKNQARAIVAVASGFVAHDEIEKAANLWSEALSVVSRIDDPAVRSIETAYVADSIIETDPVRAADLLRQASERAQAIGDEWSRSFASNIVARFMLRSDPQGTARFALTHPPSSARDTLFERISIALARNGDLPRAIEMCQGIRELSKRVLAFARLASTAAEAFPDKARELFNSAVWEVRSIKEVALRFKTLAAVAESAMGPWPEVGGALFDGLVKNAEALSEVDRNQVLRAIVDAAKVVDTERALRVADLISEERQRSFALRDLARHIAKENPQRAVSILEPVSNPEARRQVLAAAARSFAVNNPERARELLVEVAELSDRIDLNTWYLADVAEAIAPIDSDMAAKLLERIDYPLARVKPLAALGAAVFDDDPGRGLELFQTALRLSEGESVEYYSERVLLAMGKYEPEAAAEFAQRVARNAQPYDIVRLAVAIAHCSPEVAQALIGSDKLSDASRSLALARVASKLTEVDHGKAHNMFESAIEIAENLTHERERIDTFTTIAVTMRECDVHRAAEIAERVAGLVDSDWQRAHIASVLARVDANRARQVISRIRDDYELGISLAELSIGLFQEVPETAREVLVETIEVMTAKAPGVRVIALSSSDGRAAQTLARALLTITRGDMAEMMKYVAMVPEDRGLYSLEKRIAGTLVPNSYDVKPVVLYGYVDGAADVAVPTESDNGRLWYVSEALGYLRGFLTALAKNQPEAARAVAEGVVEVALRF